MNTDEKRGKRKFEKEYEIFLDPDKWDKVFREFCEQRKNRNSVPSEDEIKAYLEERGIHCEYALA